VKRNTSVGKLLSTAVLMVVVIGCSSSITHPQGSIDTSLAGRVHEIFWSDAVLGDLMIDVEAANGTVTLAGTVPTASAAERAMTVARNVPGVTNVISTLTVGTESNPGDPQH
jgi:hypothetical protein